MTNKDYTKILHENLRLKLALEAAYAKINYIQEELENLSKGIQKVYTVADELDILNKQIEKDIKEFSENIDLELETKLNKYK